MFNFNKMCEMSRKMERYMYYVCMYVYIYIYILQDERERLIGKITRHDNWPVNKSQLGNKYIKHFIQFTNSIDFTKL